MQFSRGPAHFYGPHSHTRQALEVLAACDRVAGIARVNKTAHSEHRAGHLVYKIEGNCGNKIEGNFWNKIEGNFEYMIEGNFWNKNEGNFEYMIESHFVYKIEEYFV